MTDRKDLDLQTREDIYNEFQLYDKDGNGSIDAEEAQKVLCSKLGFSIRHTRKLIKLCDENGDGRITFNEFTDFYLAVKSMVDEMQRLFNEFDTDGDGEISTEEAKAALSNLAFNEDEIENLLRAYDENGDGRMQYEEFVKFWNSK